MKSIRFFAAVYLALTGFTVSAQDKATSFEISGNCLMCKKRIETAAMVPGVHSIDWNVKTKQASVTFDPKRISREDIQHKIAGAGHDSENFKAQKATYYNLPACCRYERAAADSLPPSPKKQQN